MKVKRVKIGRLFSSVPREYENVRVEIEFEVEGESIEEIAKKFWETAEETVRQVLKQEALRVAKEILDGLNEEREELQRKVKRSEEKKKELEAKIAWLNANIEKAEGKVKDDLAQQLRSATMELTSVEDEIEYYSKKIAGVEKEIAELKRFIAGEFDPDMKWLIKLLNNRSTF